MEREYFWLDGVRCDTVGIRLQGPVTFEAPTPKMESVPVPGKNGDLHYYEGAYNNIQGESRCFALEKSYVDKALNAIARYSLLEPGYHRLETTEEPDIYRMAAISSGNETEIRMRHLAPFTITFDCMPQKFFKDGERELKIPKSGYVIYNNGFPARPIITIRGSGKGEIAINGTVLSLLDTFTGAVVYDSETENAYYGSENKNKQIKAPEALILPNGKCEIRWSGGVESVSIIPRWWTL